MVAVSGPKKVISAISHGLHQQDFPHSVFDGLPTEDLATLRLSAPTVPLGEDDKNLLKKSFSVAMADPQLRALAVMAPHWPIRPPKRGRAQLHGGDPVQPPERRPPCRRRGRRRMRGVEGFQLVYLRGTRVVDPGSGLLTNTRHEATNLHRNLDPKFLLHVARGRGVANRDELDAPMVVGDCAELHPGDGSASHRGTAPRRVCCCHGTEAFPSK